MSKSPEGIPRCSPSAMPQPSCHLWDCAAILDPLPSQGSLPPWPQGSFVTTSLVSLFLSYPVLLALFTQNLSSRQEFDVKCFWKAMDCRHSICLPSVDLNSILVCVSIWESGIFFSELQKRQGEWPCHLQTNRLGFSEPHGFSLLLTSQADYNSRDHGAHFQSAGLRGHDPPTTLGGWIYRWDEPR